MLLLLFLMCSVFTAVQSADSESLWTVYSDYLDTLLDHIFVLKDDSVW